MSTVQSIKIAPLKPDELAEADQIVRLAFGTFLGMPNPADFMGDRTFMTSRFRSAHVKVLAAHNGGRLVGSNVITRWGSFAFFGPLTVVPEYWDHGVAQRLLESTMTVFDGESGRLDYSLFRIAPNTSPCIRSSVTGRNILRQS
jgi:hypothetical protein